MYLYIEMNRMHIHL